MTRAAKITYLGALLIGLSIGFVARYKDAMSRLDAFDDSKHTSLPFSLRTHTDSEIKAAVKAAYELWDEVATAPDESEPLREIDWATFGPKRSAEALNDRVLDANFTWTDSSGSTRDKAQVIQAFRSGKTLRLEAEGTNARATISAHVYGQVGIIQENSGNVYVLRVWVKRRAGWQALVYQAVAVGAPPTSISRAPLRNSAQASGARTREPGNGECKNPCETVPFEPQSADEREVIHAYQAVERAVTAHNSSDWGAHIADEFFAVTSNSDKPLDKATRMAGLDNQKVAGIAPFPLVSARMFEIGDAMVMISRQQPEHRLPLHVTRIWFKRNGTWLEAYSYQTTIQPTPTPH